jgi:ubiquinone/menaquinone biosynthesis C-methylase UbiE
MTGKLMKPQPEKPATFDRYAADYAALLHDPLRESFAAGNRFFFERKMQVIRRFFKNAGIEPQTLDWLDIGCGQGDMLRAGRSDFRTAAGCDPSAGMLEACAGLQVERQQSLEHLPFEDERFDFVTAVCVFHHVPRHQRRGLTREALRVLKPAGIFCVIEHNPWNPATRLIVARTPVDADAELLSPPETRRMLSKSRAEVLSTRYFLLFPELIHSYLGRVEDALGVVPLGGQYSVFARRLA